MQIRVECYAGYKADEMPLRFYLGAQRIEIKAILDRWLAPDHAYFKVRGEDGNTYILRHDSESDSWELTMFDRRIAFRDD